MPEPSGGQGIVSKKIGPLPLWIWVALGAGLGFILLRRGSKSAPSTNLVPISNPQAQGNPLLDPLTSSDSQTLLNAINSLNSQLTTSRARLGNFLSLTDKQALISSWYIRFLGRPPTDTGEISAWVNQLGDYGQNMDYIMGAIANSPEGQAYAQTQGQPGWAAGTPPVAPKTRAGTSFRPPTGGSGPPPPPGPFYRTGLEAASVTPVGPKEEVMTHLPWEPLGYGLGWPGAGAAYTQHGIDTSPGARLHSGKFQTGALNIHTQSGSGIPIAGAGPRPGSQEIPSLAIFVRPRQSVISPWPGNPVNMGDQTFLSLAGHPRISSVGADTLAHDEILGSMTQAARSSSSHETPTVSGEAGLGGAIRGAITALKFTPGSGPHGDRQPSMPRPPFPKFLTGLMIRRKTLRMVVTPAAPTLQDAVHRQIASYVSRPLSPGAARNRKY